MKYALLFNEINDYNIYLVGGKGANLGRLFNAGYNVPPAFVVTTAAFEKFYKKEINQELGKEISLALDKLKGSRFAIRSSATAEDLPNASFAGQHDTFLNVKKEDVLEKIKECWESLYTERAVYYRNEKGIKESKMAVVVQEMIDADFAGVIFTLDPVHKKDILIEAAQGLGENLVSGQITPSNYFIDRKSLEIKQKHIEDEVPERLVLEIAKTGIEIEQYFKKPQDIEFAVKDSKVFIVQSRDITTL